MTDKNTVDVALGKIMRITGLEDDQSRRSQVRDVLNELYDETMKITGADLTDGASDEEEFCGCGEPITMYDGEWLHIYNPELRGTDDHEARP